jgi:hypothetical protein
MIGLGVDVVMVVLVVFGVVEMATAVEGTARLRLVVVQVEVNAWGVRGVCCRFRGGCMGGSGPWIFLRREQCDG